MITAVQVPFPHLLLHVSHSAAHYPAVRSLVAAFHATFVDPPSEDNVIRITRWAQANIPIVTVRLSGGPFAYDFGAASEFLTHVDQRLSTIDAKVLRDAG